MECIQLVEKRIKLNCDCGFFKVILLDLSMPEMDGYQTCLKIVEILKRNNITSCHIVACSAYSDQKQKCMQIGFNDYLEKPINQD